MEQNSPVVALPRRNRYLYDLFLLQIPSWQISDRFCHSLSILGIIFARARVREARNKEASTRFVPATSAYLLLKSESKSRVRKFTSLVVWKRRVYAASCEGWEAKKATCDCRSFWMVGLGARNGQVRPQETRKASSSWDGNRWRKSPIDDAAISCWLGRHTPQRHGHPSIPLDVVLIVHSDVVRLEITVIHGGNRAVSIGAKHLIEQSLLVDAVLLGNARQFSLWSPSTPISLRIRSKKAVTVVGPNTAGERCHLPRIASHARFNGALD